MKGPCTAWLCGLLPVLNGFKQRAGGIPSPVPIHPPCCWHNGARVRRLLSAAQDGSDSHATFLPVHLRFLLLPRGIGDVHLIHNLLLVLYLRPGDNGTALVRPVQSGYVRRRHPGSMTCRSWRPGTGCKIRPVHPWYQQCKSDLRRWAGAFVACDVVTHIFFVTGCNNFIPAVRMARHNDGQ